MEDQGLKSTNPNFQTELGRTQTRVAEVESKLKPGTNVRMMTWDVAHKYIMDCLTRARDTGLTKDQQLLWLKQRDERTMHAVRPLAKQCRDDRGRSPAPYR